VASTSDRARRAGHVQHLGPAPAAASTTSAPDQADRRPRAATRPARCGQLVDRGRPRRPGRPRRSAGSSRRTWPTAVRAKTLLSLYREILPQQGFNILWPIHRMPEW